MSELTYKTINFSYTSLEEMKQQLDAYTTDGWEVLHYLPAIDPTVGEDGRSIHHMSAFLKRTIDV